MWAGAVRGARHCLSGPRMVFSPGFLCDLGALSNKLRSRDVREKG